MTLPTLHESFNRGLADAAETAAHCAVTINARLPILAACLLLPTRAGLDEWHAAVSEKVAAVEGTIAATGELGTALIRSALTPPTPAGLAEDLARVVDKAVHPTRSRARANALRFSSPRPA